MSKYLVVKYLVDYNSSHPRKCKESIPYSQLRRLRRICSNDEDFQSKAKEMTAFFHTNNYPEKITKSALDKVNNLSQDDALLPVDRNQSATSATSDSNISKHFNLQNHSTEFSGVTEQLGALRACLHEAGQPT